MQQVMQDQHIVMFVEMLFMVNILLYIILFIIIIHIFIKISLNKFNFLIFTT